MKTDQEKLEVKVGAICQDLFARKESPESAKVKIMALVKFPALPPLGWMDTISRQTAMCPLTHDTYTLQGSIEGIYMATVIPAKRIVVGIFSEGQSREITIAAIEQHRNNNLKKKLGL